MNLDDRINTLTTLVRNRTEHGQGQGSAFYYQHLSPKEGDGPQWRNVLNTWLVTNRHVVLPKVQDAEIVPTELCFHLRRVISGRLTWSPYRLSRDQLHERVRLHPSPIVDVAAIEIGDLLEGIVRDDKDEYQGLIPWNAVGPDDFAGQNKINIEVSDDVLVIGYPRGFYDTVNLFPIVKGGIVASRWGAHFCGAPHFLIDAKLFPGSSGSIVVSKPRELVLENGNLLMAKERQYAFLGVYSGEYQVKETPVELEDLIIVQKSGYNVGIVWYAHLVEEIVTSGVQIETSGS